MGELVRWLVHEDRKDLFEIAVAFVLNLLFLGLTALLLWPVGRGGLVVSLAQGYGVLWLLLGVTAPLLRGAQRLLRVSLYDHPNAYVFSNLAVSCGLQAGWAAFAALTVPRSVPGTPLSGLVLLYCAGVLSCLAAFVVVSAFYQGTVYRVISLPLALMCFFVFSAWP